MKKSPVGRPKLQKQYLYDYCVKHNIEIDPYEEYNSLKVRNSSHFFLLTSLSQKKHRQHYKQIAYLNSSNPVFLLHFIIISFYFYFFLIAQTTKKNVVLKKLGH